MTLVRYHGLSIAAHWLTLLLLAGSFSLGWYMHDLPVSPDRARLYAYHKWLGVTIFIVVALRLSWRALVPPPPLPASMRRWEKTVTRVTHGLLYALLFAVPLSGWMMSSAKGFQTVYLDLLPIPDVLSKDPELGEWFEDVHERLGQLMLGLVSLHVAAALKHHYLDRDEVLARMTPGLAPRRPRE